VRLRSVGVCPVVLLAVGAPAKAQLRGHGEPCALAISAVGARMHSGSFDASAILWSLRTSSAVGVNWAQQHHSLWLEQQFAEGRAEQGGVAPAE
jgi:hypothetical protein